MAGLLKELMLIGLLGAIAVRERAAATLTHEAKVSATILAPMPVVHVASFVPPVIVQAGVSWVHVGQSTWVQQGSVGQMGLSAASTMQTVSPEASPTGQGVSSSKANAAESAAVSGVAVTAVAAGEGRHAHQLRVLVEFN